MTPTPSSATASDKAAKLKGIEDEGVMTEPESFKNSGPPYYYKVPEKTFNELKAVLEAKATPDESLKALAELTSLEDAIGRRIKNYFQPLIDRGNVIAMDGAEEDRTIITEIRKRKTKLITAATAQKEPKEMRTRE